MNLAGIMSFIYSPSINVYDNLIHGLQLKLRSIMAFPVNFSDFLRWNATSCSIPRDKLKSRNQTSMAYSACFEYGRTHDMTPEILAMAKIYIEQIVLFNNTFRKFNKIPADVYSVENIYNMPYIFPAYPIIFSNDTTVADLSDLNLGIDALSRWHFDGLNTIMSIIIKNLKENTSEVMNILGKLSSNNMITRDTIDYSNWFNTLVNKKDSEEYNTIPYYPENDVCSNQPIYGMTAIDLLYSELALLKLADYDVYFEFNPVNGAGLYADKNANEVFLRKGVELV